MKKLLLIGVIVASCVGMGVSTKLSSLKASASSFSAQSTIIIINGCSSSGKTSSAHALQQQLSASGRPWLLMELDKQLAMLPQAWIALNPDDVGKGHPDGIRFSRVNGALHIEVGPALDKVAVGIAHAIKAYAAAGNMIIVEGALPAKDIALLHDVLKEYPTYFVGLTCDLKIMQEREVKRQGIIGLAAAQLEQLKPHDHDYYDIMIDTSYLSPDQVAQCIARHICNKTLL